MSDIKARLARLADLATGPVLIWPDVVDIAQQARAEISDLEAELTMLKARVRFYERKLLNTA
jgi:hypothetical protein